MIDEKIHTQIPYIWFKVLIGFICMYVVTFFYPSTAKAQCVPDFVDQPASNIAIGFPFEITGKGFCKNLEVSITSSDGTPLSLKTEYLDDAHITATIGSEVKTGAYKLLVGGRGFNITIIPEFKIELGRVTPNYVYNTDTADRQVNIGVTSIEGEPKVNTWSISLIGENNSNIIVPTNQSASQILSQLAFSSYFAISIPTNTTPGIYQILLKTPLVVTATNTIEVRPPINPSIDSISPKSLKQFGNENVVFTISGTNLSNIKSATFVGIKDTDSTGYLYRYDCSSLCINKTTTKNELVINTKLGLDGSGKFNVDFLFEDGTEINNQTISVIERVWPANAEGIIVLIFELLGAGIIVGGVYYFSIYVNIEDEIIANKQIVSSLRVIVSLLMASALVYLASFMLSGIGVGSSSPNLTFYIVTGLASFNTASLFVMNRVNRVFHDAIGPSNRYRAGAFFLITTWLSLYLLDIFELPTWAILTEVIIFLLILIVGLVGMSFTKQALEIERSRLDDAQILVRAEALLFSKGEITVKGSNIDAPFDRIQRAIEILNERHRNRLIAYDSVAGTLSFVRAPQIRMVHNAFTPDVESASTTRSKASKILELFDKELGFQPAQLKNTPEKDTYPFIVHGRSAPDIPWLPQNFPVILLDSNSTFTKDDIQQLKEIRNETQVKHRFGFFVPLTNLEQSKALIDAELRNRRGSTNDNLVILNKQDMLDIFSSSLQPIYKALLVPIRNQVDLQVFESVFVTFGPVSETMFYGRSQELGSIFDTIDGGNSVTIMGTRKMGKTSLLRRLEKQFRDRGKIVLYADLHAVASFTGFYYLMADKWDTFEFNVQSWSEPHHFLEYVTRLHEQHSGKQIVFMFDEVDRLLYADMQKGELLFRLFRSLSQEGKCQFVFTGERTILDAVSDANSAFWNFTVPIKLPLFDKEVTKNLIIEPFTSIGVALEQPDTLADTIYEYTSGHPTLIQTFCQQALKVLNKEEDRRLTPPIVKSIAESLKFQEDASNPFLGVFLSQSTELEKAIAVHVAYRGVINKSQLLNELRSQGFPITKILLERGVRYLSLGHVLTLCEDGTYKIKPSHLEEYMFTVPYEEYMSDLLDEYRDKDGG